MAKNDKRKKICPFHFCDGKTPGVVTLWGRVTHKYVVTVCRAHEQVYRDYGWIRRYRREARH